MKKLLIIVLVVFVFTVSIPIAVYLKYGRYEEPPADEDRSVSVYIKAQDKVVEMNENQYLKEVVSAEMPANFETEALKAQAVAARSYLWARKNAYKVSGAPAEHKGADICTDSTHCKAWISEEERKKLWGNDAEKNWQKISDAVDSTSGEVLTYNGTVISAVFHSTSSGHTENAKDVWGGDAPYLVSVESKGDDASPKYRSEKEMSLEDFKKTAIENIKGVSFEKEIIGETARSEAGGILKISVGGVKIKGTEFRKIYGLRSTNVDVKIENDTVRFDVTGFGHGVGMSQYGANYLASNGKGYKEILKTYYTGVEVEKK